MRSSRNAFPVALLLLAVAACGPLFSNDPGVTGDFGRVPTPTATPLAGHHHPPGWADSSTHGAAAKLVAEDCRGCHGTDLTGGTWNNGTTTVAAVSCDGCHTAGWRTNCVFCHGGTHDTTGAPPRDITGETVNLVFLKHQQHINAGTDHVAYDCVECHAKPTDALTPNHWFDNTPGWAEVD